MKPSAVKSAAAAPDREEGVLNDLLGLLDAPRHQVDRAEELASLGLEELLEGHAHCGRSHLGHRPCLPNGHRP